MRYLLALCLIVVSLFIPRPATAQNSRCVSVYPTGATEISLSGSAWNTANTSGLPSLHALIGCPTWIPFGPMPPTLIQVRINGKVYPSYARGDKVIVVSADRLYAVDAIAWQNATVSLTARRNVNWK